MHKQVRLQDHLEEIVSPTSDTIVVMSSPLSSAREFEFLDQGTLFNLELVESHSKTWSQHMNDLIIDMCLASHNL
jgi:hypothetical protein